MSSYEIFCEVILVWESAKRSLQRRVGAKRQTCMTCHSREARSPSVRSPLSRSPQLYAHDGSRIGSL